MHADFYQATHLAKHLLEAIGHYAIIWQVLYAVRHLKILPFNFVCSLNSFYLDAAFIVQKSPELWL